MHFSHQLSILKNKLLHLESSSDSDLQQCKHLFSKINKHVSLLYIRRAIGATAFALLLQWIVCDAEAQQRATFNFGSAQFNPYNFPALPNSALVFPMAADMDNDGDVDIIVSYLDTLSYSVKFSYIKNIGNINSPAFGTPTDEIFSDPIISEEFPVYVPTLVDLDGDGDLDIMVGGYDYTATYYNGKFTYYENTGSATNPQFANGTDNPFGLQPSQFAILWFPTFADIDGDGDNDMLASSYYAGIQYFKNNGTAAAPQFAAPIDINSAFEIAETLNLAFPFLADLDNDADIDLFIIDYYNDRFVFYENIGTPTAPQFASLVQNPGNLSYTGSDLTPYFVKFDNDADMDMFTGTYGGVFYRQNLEFSVGIHDVLVRNVTLAPTVSQDFIHVLNLKNAIQYVAVYDMMGRLLPVDFNNQSVNIQSLPQGQYHLRIIDTNGEVYTAPFVKQ